MIYVFAIISVDAKGLTFTGKFEMDLNLFWDLCISRGSPNRYILKLTLIFADFLLSSQMLCWQLSDAPYISYKMSLGQLNICCSVSFHPQNQVLKCSSHILSLCQDIWYQIFVKKKKLKMRVNNLEWKSMRIIALVIKKKFWHDLDKLYSGEKLAHFIVGGNLAFNKFIEIK